MERKGILAFACFSKVGVYENCPTSGTREVARASWRLSPIVGVVDSVWGDVESFSQRFDKDLQALYLAIGWQGVLSVTHEADANGPGVPPPARAAVGGQLLFPFCGRLYLAFVAALTVAQTEVAVDIFGPYQAVQ